MRYIISNNGYYSLKKGRMKMVNDTNTNKRNILKTTKKERESMKQNGISASVFSHRVKRQGWDRKRASTQPPHPTLD